MTDYVELYTHRADIQTVAQRIPHIAVSIARGIFSVLSCIFSVILYRVYTVYAVFAVLWRNIEICTGGCSKCIMIVYYDILSYTSYTLPCVYSLVCIVIVLIIYVVDSRIPAKVS